MHIGLHSGLRLVIREVGLDFTGDTGALTGRADLEVVRLTAAAGIPLAMVSLATTHSTILQDEWIVTIVVCETCRCSTGITGKRQTTADIIREAHWTTSVSSETSKTLLEYR
jgi:hypothetical protein